MRRAQFGPRRRLLALILLLVLGGTDLLFGWHHIYWGPVKNPEASDYVVAWVGRLPRRKGDFYLEVVPPGKWFWAGPTGDLDLFIRRDLSAIRFRGLLAYVHYWEYLSREEFLVSLEHKDKARLLARIDALFAAHPRRD